MRRAAGVVILALVCAFAVPIAFARPAAAFNSPTLTPLPASGDVGTGVSYTYAWDSQTGDCPSPPTDSLEIEVSWDTPALPPWTGAANPGTCDGTVSAPIPNGSPVGNHVATASLYDNTTQSLVPNSEAQATVDVTPTPTPTPPGKNSNSPGSPA